MSSPASAPLPESSPANVAAPDTAPRTYTPGQLGPKLAYLAAGLVIFGIGVSFLWEPLGRLLFGATTEARVAEIHVVEPGRPDVIYNYRRDYPPEPNLAITFRHYVAIEIDGQPVLFRLGIDSRKAPIPYHNVNDRERVAYYPDDPRRLAFPVGRARTWGAATIFCGVGLFILVAAMPMVLVARRPIMIDPEAPSPASPSS